MKSWLETDRGDQIILEGLCSIGRGQSNHIILNTAAVSRHHAIIHERDKEFWMVDLGGINGVHVNGNRVVEPVQLKPGDHVQIPSTSFIFRQQPASAFVPAAAQAGVSRDPAPTQPRIETKESAELTAPLPLPRVTPAQVELFSALAPELAREPAPKEKKSTLTTTRSIARVFVAPVEKPSVENPAAPLEKAKDPVTAAAPKDLALAAPIVVAKEAMPSFVPGKREEASLKSASALLVPAAEKAKELALPVAPAPASESVPATPDKSKDLTLPIALVPEPAVVAKPTRVKPSEIPFPLGVAKVLAPAAVLRTPPPLPGMPTKAITPPPLMLMPPPPRHAVVPVPPLIAEPMPALAREELDLLAPAIAKVTPEEAAKAFELVNAPGPMVEAMTPPPLPVRKKKEAATTTVSLSPQREEKDALSEITAVSSVPVTAPLEETPEPEPLAPQPFFSELEPGQESFLETPAPATDSQPIAVNAAHLMAQRHLKKVSQPLAANVRKAKITESVPLHVNAQPVHLPSADAPPVGALPKSAQPVVCVTAKRSMYIGLASVFLPFAGVITAVIAIAMGHTALRNIRLSRGVLVGRESARMGLTFGYITLVLISGYSIALYCFFSTPATTLPNLNPATPLTFSTQAPDPVTHPPQPDASSTATAANSPATPAPAPKVATSTPAPTPCTPAAAPAQPSLSPINVGVFNPSSMAPTVAPAVAKSDAPPAIPTPSPASSTPSAPATPAPDASVATTPPAPAPAATTLATSADPLSAPAAAANNAASSTPPVVVSDSTGGNATALLQNNSAQVGAPTPDSAASAPTTAPAMPAPTSTPAVYSPDVQNRLKDGMLAQPMPTDSTSRAYMDAESFNNCARILARQPDLKYVESVGDFLDDAKTRNVDPARLQILTAMYDNYMVALKQSQQ